MTMSQLVSIACSICISATVAFAEPPPSNPATLDPAAALEVLKSDLATKKLMLMAEGMALPEQEGKRFWPLYKEFLQKRQKANDGVVLLISSYAKNPVGFDNDDAKRTFKKVFAANRTIQALEEEYFNKIAKATTPTIAARFLQIEDILNTGIKFQIFAKLPLFPKIIEADKKADEKH